MMVWILLLSAPLGGRARESKAFFGELWGAEKGWMSTMSDHKRPC